MQCTIENINIVFNKISEMHMDTSSSFAEFNDESDLLDAVENVIEWFSEQGVGYRNANKKDKP